MPAISFTLVRGRGRVEIKLDHAAIFVDINL
jgi:hypothetical protein